MEEPKVTIALRPHIEISYDLDKRPHNKCVFPATPDNVRDIQVALGQEMAKVAALETLAG